MAKEKIRKKTKQSKVGNKTAEHAHEHEHWSFLPEFPLRLGEQRWRRSIEGSATFGRPVVKASVAMNGFKLDFASSDHHINIVEADTDIVRD